MVREFYINDSLTVSIRDFIMAGKRKEHHYQTLQQTVDKLMTNFNHMLKKCSAEITQMCRSEKETWQKVDQVEEECQSLIRQVEAKADDLVSIFHPSNPFIFLAFISM